MARTLAEVVEREAGVVYAAPAPPSSGGVVTMRRPALIVLSAAIAAVLSGAACGGNQPAAPSAQPSQPSQPTQTQVPVFAVSGRVTAGQPVTGSPSLPAAGSPLRWVKVEVTGGKADLLGKSAATDGDGRFRLEGLSGEVTLKASRDGCEDATKLVTVSADTTVNFELRTVQQGRIADLQAASDIVTLNMQAPGGSSYRRTDLICRWELPVPVYLDHSLTEIDRSRVVAALDYWQATAGITYTVVASSALPRLLIRSGTDGLAPWGGGRSVLDGTFSNNRASSGLVVYEPGGGTYCQAATQCEYLFRHELGHTLGIYVNTNFGLMGGTSELSARERAMLATLYSLPHGARVQTDGTWQVVMP